MKSILNIMKKRNFISLFGVQFFGILNDNMFRIFLLACVTIETINAASPASKDFSLGISALVFILPFLIFSAVFGSIADKFEKVKLIKYAKLAEIAVMLLAAIGFVINNSFFLMFVLFLMGTQSAFFGPLKYSIIPEILKEKEYVSGNGIIEAGTFLAILSGIFLGSYFSRSVADGKYIIYAASLVLIVVSVVGCMSAYFMKEGKAINPEAPIEKNLFKATLNNLKCIKQTENIFLTILGISWFWAVGAVLVSKMPVFVETVIGGTYGVFAALLIIFAVGVVIGSLSCQFVLKDEISAKYVPVTIIVATLFMLDLSLAAFGYVQKVPSLNMLNPLVGLKPVTAAEFLSSFSGFRISFDIFMIALLGGVYVVPLNALLQKDADGKSIGQIMAANNVMNSLLILLVGLVSIILAVFNFSVPFILLVLTIANLCVAVYICLILPSTLFKMLIRNVLRMVYKVDIRGLENYKDAVKPSIIMANHQSFLDPILLGAFLPGRPVFAINTFIADNPFLKPLLKLVDVVPIDPTNPMTTKTLAEAVDAGRTVVIFPESRMTTTGSLMKIYEGIALVADLTKADIVPVRIAGAEYSVFSGFRKQLNFNPSGKITITILPPRKLDISDELQGKERRNMVKRKISDIMNSMMYETNRIVDLFRSLLDARSLYGGSYRILEDITREVLDYNDIVRKSIAYGDKLRRLCRDEENVGIMLSNLNVNVLLFFGLQYLHKVPAMINFSSGVANIVSVVNTAKVKTVITSSQFVAMNRLEKVVDALRQEGVKVLYAEDIRDSIGMDDEFKAYLKSKFARLIYRKGNPEDAAVILFTSGSEGKPKGVVLSHKNLRANHIQFLTIFPLNFKDVFFTVLPMFHSFGLNTATLTPIMSGMKVFLYPSPLNYRAIPELVYDINATVMFGTDTFLSGYAKVADNYDFYSMRAIIAGAEKTREITRRIYSDRFGVRIYDGYGTTEASPVITMNNPMNCKFGTVGRFIPNIEYRLDDVEGVEDGKRLLVKGPNLMKGYIRPENPGVLEPLGDNWYDTGDIVTVDEDGFATIRGRAKRFAKIGGEMVSLDATEGYIKQMYPDFRNAVICVPSEKKGEELVLVTTNQDANVQSITSFFKENGLPEIAIPKNIQHVEEVPIIGSGKTDYMKLKKMFGG